MTLQSKHRREILIKLGYSNKSLRKELWSRYFSSDTLVNAVKLR